MKKVLISLGVLATPMLAFAQQGSCVNTTGLFGVLCIVSNLFNTIIPILITLGILFFIWSLIQFLLGKSEEAKKEASGRMLWAVIIFFVILSLWGLVHLLQSTFGLSSGQLQQGELPTIY